MLSASSETPLQYKIPERDQQWSLVSLNVLAIPPAAWADSTAKESTTKHERPATTSNSATCRGSIVPAETGHLVKHCKPDFLQQAAVLLVNSKLLVTCTGAQQHYFNNAATVSQAEPDET